jgi:hypothetical protein
LQMLTLHNTIVNHQHHWHSLCVAPQATERLEPELPTTTLDVVIFSPGPPPRLPHPWPPCHRNPQPLPLASRATMARTPCSLCRSSPSTTTSSTVGAQLSHTADHRRSGARSLDPPPPRPCNRTRRTTAPQNHTRAPGPPPRPPLASSSGRRPLATTAGLQQPPGQRERTPTTLDSGAAAAPAGASGSGGEGRRERAERRRGWESPLVAWGATRSGSGWLHAPQLLIPYKSTIVTEVQRQQQVAVCALIVAPITLPASASSLAEWRIR